MEFTNIEYLKDEVVKYRRQLHEHPEIDNDVDYTREYILKHLIRCNFDRIEVIACGIKAVMVAKDPGYTFAFRADMDGLPIAEETKLSFASKREGYMHACGHDGHMAMLLGFARWLGDNKGHLKHNVVLIFQPAEETEGGALNMIDGGVLENPEVDAIFGFHIMPEIPQGSFGISPGTIMAQTCEFDIEIMGKSAHGAMPHKGVDAILASSFFISSLQSVTSRMIDPMHNAVITVGKLEAGDNRNILAEYATIQGVIRTFSDGDYKKIKDDIQSLLKGIDRGFKTVSSYKEVIYYPPVQNDAYWTNTIKHMIDDHKVMEIMPIMIADDFSYYQQNVPGVYIFLGSNDQEMGYTMPLHSNKFDFDEKILMDGIKLCIKIACSGY